MFTFIYVFCQKNGTKHYAHMKKIQHCIYKRTLAGMS